MAAFDTAGVAVEGVSTSADDVAEDVALTSINAFAPDAILTVRPTSAFRNENTIRSGGIEFSLYRTMDSTTPFWELVIQVSGLNFRSQEAANQLAAQVVGKLEGDGLITTRD